MIYLIEMGAYDPSAGGETTLRFAGGVDHYTTRPSDDPPNAEYDGRVSDPGNFERHLFGRNRTSAPASSSSKIPTACSTGFLR